MKGNIFKITVVLLFLVGTFSCSEKSEPDSDFVASVKKNLIGKWKLEKVEIAISFGNDEESDLTTFDYSQNNIIYEFKANNTLIVSGSSDKIDYRGHKIGSHVYKVQLPPPNPLALYLYNFLLIDNLSHSFNPNLVFSENLLELAHGNYEEDYSYIELYTYSLIKIGEPVHQK